MPTTKELITFLKAQNIHTSKLDELKIAYRPAICPFDELLDLIKDGDKVFDVGCGSGQFCLLVANFSKPACITGIEIAENLIENARQLFETVETTAETSFEVYDGSTFPDSMGEHDILFLIDVLHHVPKAQQSTFLKGIYDKMKPGARLVVKDINASSPLVVMNKIHDRLLAGEFGRELGFEDLKERVKALGFSIVHESKRRMWWYPHYTVIVEK